MMNFAFFPIFLLFFWLVILALGWTLTENLMKAAGRFRTRERHHQAAFRGQRL